MNLKSRTILGFVALIGGMGAMLFAPAGTLDFWQAWVYLLVFGCSAALITVYLWKRDAKLLERRVTAGPGAEKRTTQNVIQAIASIVFIGSFVVAAFDHRFSWSEVPPPIVIAAETVVALGFFIIFVVFRENTFTAAIIEVAADQKVISTGPYTTVRHPMYSGALLMLVATPIALGSWWALLMFIPMALTIVWRLFDEEKFLAENLPGYSEYCNKVRYRLVPFVF